MSQKITNEHSSEMLYGIDEQPPKGMAVLLAFQHILAAFRNHRSASCRCKCLGIIGRRYFYYGISLYLCCWYLPFCNLKVWGQ